ncbi:acyl-CoA-binding domain-containing protein 6 [Pyxicephalus adspersus]|uniref:Acyl-CoA-binding domain-containing protein 6 n=1 Tax=Pyxicephalus adspersus TaxID=30357 RepID=A0AAV2ZUY1_PYXAD|nr:TPA: hypothetical protein GDO54_016324 [Pyxicephalus adspersus]
MASFEESDAGEALTGSYVDLGDFLVAQKAEEELRADFEQATKHAQRLAHIATTNQLLYLYARYKQAKVGKCNIPKPGFFDYEGKRKWDAWRSLVNYTPQQAMREYIDAIKKLDPDWCPKSADEPVEEHRIISIGSFGGRVVSCLCRLQEPLRDEDKDIFDYCRENDIARISQGLAAGTIDIKATDDEGRGLLHWACDRGHLELVSILYYHDADLNMQDSEGQTPLHYASACEFADIVDFLLNHGADPLIVDNDGFRADEATDSKLIANMLKQHATHGEHDKPPSLSKMSK